MDHVRRPHDAGPVSRGLSVRVAFAAFVAVGILALRQMLAPLVPVHAVPYALLFPTVAALGWYAGFLPAMTVVLLGAAGTSVLALEPIGSFAVASTADRTGLALFLVGGTATALVGALAYRGRSAVEAKSRAADAREAMVAEMLGSITDGFIRVDRDWTMTYVNTEVLRRHPDVRPMVGRNLWEAFPGAIGTIAHVQLGDAMRSRHPCEYEYHYPPLDVWLADTAYPLEDGGLAILSRDVTEAHRARAMREEQSRVVELVAREAPIDACLQAIVDAVARVAPGVHACLRVRDGDGRTDTRFVDMVTPAALRDASAATASDPATAATGAGGASAALPPLLSTPVVLGDGHDVATLTLHVEDVRTPAPWDGAVAHFGAQLASVALGRHASRQRELRSQTLWLALVEACPFGIYVVDDTLRIAHMNARTREGAFANVDPVIGRPFGEAVRIVWPEDVAAAIVAEFRRTLETGVPYRSHDFVHARADRDAVEGYEWELHRITLPDGRHGVVCYYFDSTPLRTVERALMESDRRKDEFIATLAHELRNPLAPLRTGAYVMRASLDDRATLEQLLPMFERQIEHLVRLVDDLLEVARITGGKVQLRTEVLDLVPAVRHAVDAARPAATAAGHRLELHVPAQGIVVDADPVRIAQIVSNLLSNAIKYTPAGGRIDVCVLEDDDGAACIRVRDTGMGIPVGMLPRVFDLFAQVDRSLGRAQGGLGIGLALVRQLATLHGGSVRAESPGLDRGATFEVRLPVAQLSMPLGVAPAAAAPARVLAGLDLLVVDDNVDAARSLAMLLRHLGADTRVVHDGAAAIDAATRAMPAAAFVDIGMPDVDGHAVAGAVRALPGGDAALLVAVTGFGQDEDRARSFAAGFDQHLVKPADAPALLSALSPLLAARSAVAR